METKNRIDEIANKYFDYVGKLKNECIDAIRELLKENGGEIEKMNAEEIGALGLLCVTMTYDGGGCPENANPFADVEGVRLYSGEDCFCKRGDVIVDVDGGSINLDFHYNATEIYELYSFLFDLTELRKENAE